MVVMDLCERAMDTVRQRNAAGGRLGLACIVADPSSSETELDSPTSGGSLAQDLNVGSLRFDLVVDKCTLDIMLTNEDGWERASRALKWLHDRMRTPGTLLLVSHSPPHERVELLNTVYWHDMQFKVIKCTTVEELMSGRPYREKLEDYPFTVPEWEKQLAIRRAASAAAHHQKCVSPGGDDLVYGATTESFPVEGPMSTLLEGCMQFSLGTAFVYILEK